MSQTLSGISAPKEENTRTENFTWHVEVVTDMAAGFLAFKRFIRRKLNQTLRQVSEKTKLDF